MAETFKMTFLFVKPYGFKLTAESHFVRGKYLGSDKHFIAK